VPGKHYLSQRSQSKVTFTPIFMKCLEWAIPWRQDVEQGLLRAGSSEDGE
jgi:hypothetical protein